MIDRQSARTCLSSAATRLEPLLLAAMKTAISCRNWYVTEVPALSRDAASRCGGELWSMVRVNARQADRFAAVGSKASEVLPPQAASTALAAIARTKARVRLTARALSGAVSLPLDAQFPAQPA